MDYITSKNIELNKCSIVTIGNFDGVHLGHADLINQVKSIKSERYIDCNSVVFSFNPHPRAFFSKSELKLIFDSVERFNIFENMGVDVLIEYPFDLDTKNMSKDDFITDILINKLKCKVLVVGENWNFGKDKEGNAKSIKLELEKFGVEVIIRESILYNGEKLGSTTIRDILTKGDMEEVSKLLNKPYFIIGEVIHGKQLGRTIGFPTMNIIPAKDKLLPPNGVYVSYAYIDNIKYKSITNIGFNPTVEGRVIVVETHIIDFQEDVYGKTIKVEILKKVRDEKKFKNIDELKNQINYDVSFLEEYY